MTIHAFRAGGNGTTKQTEIPNNAYTQVKVRSDFSFQGVAGYDRGTEFNNTTWSWTPQAGPIQWDAQAWITADFGSAANSALVLTVFKNDLDWLAGLGGATVNTYAGCGQVLCSGSDIANGTDVYKLMLYAGLSDGLANGVLDADPRHVRWTGLAFGT